MITLFFGIAYKKLEMDDDLQFFFIIFAIVDGMAAWACFSELVTLIINKIL